MDSKSPAQIRHILWDGKHVYQNSGKPGIYFSNSTTLANSQAVVREGKVAGGWKQNWRRGHRKLNCYYEVDLFCFYCLPLKAGVKSISGPTANG